MVAVFPMVCDDSCLARPQVPNTFCRLTEPILYLCFYCKKILFIAWIQRPVVARNLNFIWIQVYTECAPIGPPARVSVPCASSYNDNEDDDDDSDMRSNQLLTSSSLVLDIRKAVKLAFANDLVGMSTATFQVFPSTWIPGSPSSSPPLDSQDYWTPNQTLSSSHGGLAEQSPLIVWVEPTQRKW